MLANRANITNIFLNQRRIPQPFPPCATRSDRTIRNGRTTRFAPEAPRLRESLTESRTMKDGGAAGVATIGASGVEVVQQAVADTQSTLQPLIPYLDMLRWRQRHHLRSLGRLVPGETVTSPR